MLKTTHIRVAGFGGQGVMMFGQMLAYSATIEELNTLWFPSYGPETRGGTANCAVIVSSSDINSPVFQKADHLIAFNLPSYHKFHDKMMNDGLVLYNQSLIDHIEEKPGVLTVGIPINDIAAKIGNDKVLNMVMLGAYLELTQLFNKHTIEAALKKFLGNTKSHMLDINIEALNQGSLFIKQLGVQYAKTS